MPESESFGGPWLESCEMLMDILAQLRPPVREAIKSGQPVHVGANWWCRATAEQERLEADLLPWAEGPPLVSMTVTPGKGDAPALLEVEAASLLQAAAHGWVAESQADMAGDLARCLAWAWLASQRKGVIGAYFETLRTSARASSRFLKASHGLEPLKSHVLRVARPRESPACPVRRTDLRGV